MQKCLLFGLVCALIEMLLCERLHNAEVVRLREGARERLPVGRVRIRSSSKFYFPPLPTIPELQPGESSPFPKDDYLFKTLKQLLNQTRKILEPRENWSRADDDSVDYKNDDENSITDRKGNANLLNSNKKRKRNKKCKCECEKDLIIKVPKYIYKDVPLGKEVKSNHIHGEQYDSSPPDGRATFESLDPDQEPKESTRINQVKLKQKGQENNFDKRDGYAFRKLIKSRLPEKNFNYVKKRFSNRKRSNVKKRTRRPQNGAIKRKADDSLSEDADSTNEEPVDFIYNGDYLDRSDESNDPRREDYHQYIDFDSQDVDIEEDYDSEENLTENKSLENYYDAEQIQL